MVYETTPPPSHYEQMVHRQVVQTKQLAFLYMQQLQGWCSREKAETFIDLILKEKTRIVVEIGVFHGKSLIPAACAVRANDNQGMVYGIDPWDSEESVKGLIEDANKTFWRSVNHQILYETLLVKITQFGLDHHIKLLKTTAEKAEPISNIGLLHIDGNHSEKESYENVIKWAPLVIDGGYIILDDLLWYEGGHNTTAKASAWLDAHCERIGVIDNGNCGIWRKPAQPAR